jgi:hypothetical protein
LTCAYANREWCRLQHGKVPMLTDASIESLYQNTIASVTRGALRIVTVYCAPH